MKKLLVISMLVMGSVSAQAAKYDCSLSNGTPNDPKAVKYQIDTATEENKFIDMGQGTSVGCVVFRSQPQLLTCGIGNGEIFSVFGTTEDGTSILSIQTNSQGNKSALNCIKQH